MIGGKQHVSMALHLAGPQVRLYPPCHYRAAAREQHHVSPQRRALFYRGSKLLLYIILPIYYYSAILRNYDATSSSCMCPRSYKVAPNLAEVHSHPGSTGARAAPVNSVAVASCVHHVAPASPTQPALKTDVCVFNQVIHGTSFGVCRQLDENGANLPAVVYLLLYQGTN